MIIEVDKQTQRRKTTLNKRGYPVTTSVFCCKSLEKDWTIDFVWNPVGLALISKTAITSTLGETSEGFGHGCDIEETRISYCPFCGEKIEVREVG